MRKQQDRKTQVEYEKPHIKFIEQFRMRVNGNRDYDINDKIEKKVKQDEPKNNDEDYDIDNAQIVDEQDQTKPKVVEVQKADQKHKPVPIKPQQKKQSLDEAIKKLNKPTILSFDEDDI
ncbi:hypothetical protein pb186bvf_016976 [Paramecium bursaria]